MNQGELGTATGVSVPAIVRAENGEDIFPSTGRKLCEFLGVDLNIAVVPRTQEAQDEEKQEAS